MDELQGALEWVQRWPALTLSLLGIACAGESILVLGALIPTTAVLFAGGALVAFGVFDFWQVTAAATLGAMAGDSLNFWIGRHYGERMLDSRWAQRNAAAVDRSRRIMQGNEVKGLFIGRYVGLVRPFIAALAGAHAMSWTRFLLIELLACLSWAGGLILIGVVFSASLALAAEVATRLAVLLVVLIGLIWLGFWLSGRAIAAAQRRAQDWLTALLDWSHRHRRLGRMGEALADPQQPETPGLAIAALLLLALGAAWMTLVWGLGWRDYPPALDALVYQTLQNLQTPWATALAVALAQLGEWPVTLPVALAVLIALGLRRRRAAAHWIAAVAFGAALAFGLFALPTFSTPLEFYHGTLARHFSGRELVLSTVIYGFLPVLFSTRGATRARTWLHAASVTLLLLIVLAELYLGAQWFSHALIAALLGGLWAAALGLGYRRHGADPVAVARVLPIALLAFVSAAALHWTLNHGERADAARPRWTLSAMPAAHWWSEGWRQLPAQRVDMTGRETTPFNLQWAGDLRDIENAMAAQGWRWPVRLSGANLLRWLAPEATLGELPLLPQVHAGRHQALMLRRPLDDRRQVLVQLWPSSWRVKDGERIWVGRIAVQEARTLTRLFRYPVTVAAEPPARESLGAVAGFRLKQVERGGALWLLRPQGAGTPDDEVVDE